MRLSKTHRGRLERGIVLVAAVGLHALVLMLLARPVTLIFADRSDDEDAVDVTLERPRRPVKAAAPAEASAPVLAPRAAAAPAPPAVETSPFTAQASAPAAPAGPSAPGPPAANLGADLGAALRRGGFACAGGRDARLSPEERARCEEKLGALALKAPSLPAPIDPGKRAYYDAVAEAYRDRRAFVPLTARGAKGMFELDDSVHQGHGPRVGCSVKFGPNADKAPKGPANALRAGPCFIQPPVGSLTPEGDIRKPY